MLERVSRGTTPTTFDRFGKPLIVAAVIVSILSSVIFTPQRPTGETLFWSVLGGLSAAYALFVAWHALRYRPVVTAGALPRVTVVVPAFNEGPMVQTAILSALESDYPSELLEIVAVDDGSSDDTWSYMSAVAAAFPDRVMAVRLPQNGGKREALREGFLRARGEVVVTVDSDSRLDRSALREIVAPLVSDPSVAAVAGKVVVLNRYESVVTRILAARFFVTFDLARAVQSRFGAVLCCPGALTAYRRSAVLAVLDRWSTQTFLGSPCTIGEDRALTTWLLRTGHRTVYQATAVVETLAPTTMPGMTRMLLRWERGNVRESLAMAPLLFTPWRTRDRWWPTLEIATEILQYPLAFVVIGFAVRHLVLRPLDVFHALAVVTTFAFVQALYCLRTERSSDLLYNVGYALVAFAGLQWIFPYSFLTMANGKWLTR